MGEYAHNGYMTTQERILAAAAREIENYGLTQFRVKRVAADVGISISVLYSYFEDREELIAVSIVHRYREAILGIVDALTLSLMNVETTEDLRQGLALMITETVQQIRAELRARRIESISFARHNMTASLGIASARKEADTLMLNRIQPIVDKGLLAENFSALTFSRIWYSLFFGQTKLEGDNDLSIDSEEWLDSLRLIANAIVRTDVKVS
jgi:AcrR family transcriptional regulator